MDKDSFYVASTGGGMVKETSSEVEEQLLFLESKLEELQRSTDLIIKKLVSVSLPTNEIDNYQIKKCELPIMSPIGERILRVGDKLDDVIRQIQTSYNKLAI